MGNIWKAVPHSWTFTIKQNMRLEGGTNAENSIKLRY